MNRKMKTIAAASVAVVALGIGTGVAVAAAGDDGPDAAVPAAEVDRVHAAALQAAGGDGRVTESEREGTGFDVEVTRTDGTEVEVHLDADLRVVPDADTDDDLYDEDGPNDDLHDDDLDDDDLDDDGPNDD